MTKIHRNLKIVGYTAFQAESNGVGLIDVQFQTQRSFLNAKPYKKKSKGMEQNHMEVKWLKTTD